MSPAFQAVFLPLVAVIFGWRLVVLLRSELRAPGGNAMRRTMIAVYVGCATFAVATYYGIESISDGVYIFRIWFIWLEYLAIMILVRSLAQAFGVRVAGHYLIIFGICSVTAVFASLTPTTWTGRFVDAPTTMLVLYAISAGCYMPIVLATVAVHIFSQPRPNGSMWVSVVAMILSTSGLALGFTLNAIEFGIYLSRHSLPPLIEPISRAVLDSGVVLMVIGTLTPTIVSRVAHLRRTAVLARELRVMRPLADALDRMIPQSELMRYPQRHFTPSQIRLRHYCRYVQIRDGLTRLSNQLDDGDVRDVGVQLRSMDSLDVGEGREIAQPLIFDVEDDAAAILQVCRAYNDVESEAAGVIE